MQALEQLLGLFVIAVLLAAAARRVGAPYPVFLALGGALIALLPSGPAFTLPPELALALFVAPVLLDSAYDMSLRDLRDNWAPVTGLVVFAVGLTTAAVAVVAHALVPALPWAAAVAWVRSSHRPMRWPPAPCCGNCIRHTGSSPSSRARAC